MIYYNTIRYDTISPSSRSPARAAGSPPRTRPRLFDNEHNNNDNNDNNDDTII